MKTLAVILSLLASTASAQVACAPRDDFVSRLFESYGESRQVAALTASRTLLELFASEAGSWTITITAPGGLTCLAASGTNYEHSAEPPMPLGQEG